RGESPFLCFHYPIFGQEQPFASSTCYINLRAAHTRLATNASYKPLLRLTRRPQLQLPTTTAAAANNPAQSRSVHLRPWSLESHALSIYIVSRSPTLLHLPIQYNNHITSTIAQSTSCLVPRTPFPSHSSLPPVPKLLFPQVPDLGLVTLQSVEVGPPEHHLPRITTASSYLKAPIFD
ncbi:hypothetical protein CH063_02368, partial [Colletotrichum higginsianum]